MEKAAPENTQTTFQKASFLIYLLAVTAAFLFLLQNFLMVLVLAAVFTGLTYPVYAWFLAKVRKPPIAALLTLLSVLLVLVLPLIAVGTIAYQEAVGFFGNLDVNTWRGHLEGAIQSVRDRFPSLLQKVNTENLTGMAISGVQNGFQFALKHSADISLSLANNVLNFFLMLFVMFYFYLDGKRILERLIRWSPLKDEYERILIEKFLSVSKGTLKGILVIGVIQGILGAILFWAVGLSSPVFLGTLMVFASIIPAVGTAGIWGPAAAFLLFEGRWGAALAVVFTGAVVIGSVDNFVRPILVGKDIKMHDLLVLLSTLGGLAVFGLTGLIIGPIIASMFLSIWNIFEEVFAEELAANRQSGFRTGEIARMMKEPPPATSPGKPGKK
ncbi:MAG TPA: AI-2E family transporter [Fibrobacteria bacterium]|nr:AI-2E family transporter [Fibrobacteria bacterium]